MLWMLPVTYKRDPTRIKWQGIIPDIVLYVHWVAWWSIVDGNSM